MDDFKIFPTRFGTPQGDALENRMLFKAGDIDGFKTVIITNADGTTTRLRTRGGMPEFVTSVEKKAEDTGCLHGLYYGGVITYGGGGYVVAGGMVRKDDGAVVTLPGKRPILGDAFRWNKDLVAGDARRICGGTELGSGKWYVTSSGLTNMVGEIILPENQPLARSDGVALHQYSITITGSSTQTITGSVAGLVRGNLSDAGEYGDLDGEVFNQHSAKLVDVSSDGRKLLVEIHENLVIPLGTLESANRQRLSMPLTFVSAYEIVLANDPPGMTATATVLVTPRPYYRPGVGISQPSPLVVGSPPNDPPTFPTDYQQHYSPVGGENLRTIYGVCYSVDDVATPFYCFRTTYGMFPSLDFSEAWKVGSQSVFNEHWTSGSFYTNPSYSEDNPLTWNYRLYYPIRLSNRVFTMAVSDQWLADYAYAPPYNQWRLASRASPDAIDSSAVTLPKDGSWRMAYEFYYKGIEPEVYPNIYGSSRATTGQVATALTKTLCWV